MDGDDLRLLEFLRIFSKCFLTLLADERHVKALQQRVVGLLLVAFGAIEPFSTLRWVSQAERLGYRLLNSGN